MGLKQILSKHKQKQTINFVSTEKTINTQTNIIMSTKSNETKNDKRIKCFCFNIIANNLSGLKLHLKAIQYYLKAEKNSLSESQKYTIYNNISQEYINLKEHQNAAEYLMKIISSKKIQIIKSHQIHLKLNEIKNKIKYQKITTTLNQA